MAMHNLIAIDPGPRMSRVCVIDSDTYKPIIAGKIENPSVYETVAPVAGGSNVVIEMVAHYGTGMPAGRDVFDTCVWIGRFYETFAGRGSTVTTLPRKTVKMHLCGSMRAKDSNIRQSLVDRFAPGERNYGKGTKAKPGFFYGFAADAWQAYALGVTYLDIRRDKDE
jgi:hypothetical protein